MAEFIKTYKNLFHVLLGVILLSIFDSLLKPVINDSLYFIPVFICCACGAFFAEWIQPQLRLGTATFIGGIKTLIVPIIYLLMEVYNIIF